MVGCIYSYKFSQIDFLTLFKNCLFEEGIISLTDSPNLSYLSMLRMLMYILKTCRGLTESALLQRLSPFSFTLSLSEPKNKPGDRPYLNGEDEGVRCVGALGNRPRLSIEAMEETPPDLSCQVLGQLCLLAFRGVTEDE